MPSRRRYLAAAAGLAAAPLSGCLVDRARAETGYVQVEGVSVSWRHDGRLWEDEIFLATLDGESELRCRVAEEDAAMADDPTEIRVVGETERRIERGFIDVTGFCWSDDEATRAGSRGLRGRVQSGPVRRPCRRRLPVAGRRDPRSPRGGP